MDLILSLPIHPLINHFVAVLVPISALAVILLLTRPKLRSTYSLLLLVTLAAAALSAQIAENSGQSLANRVGNPGDHAEQGERLAKVVLLFFVIYLIWILIEKRAVTFKSNDKLIKSTLNLALLLVAILSAILTFLVGHSGAAATWQDRIAVSGGKALSDTTAKVQPDSTAQPEGSAIVLTNSEVKKHNSKGDCWSIVNNKVFNLTSYVAQHPGGSAVISNICGKDGSAAFSNQHGQSAKPNNVLSGLLLGVVGDQITKSKAEAVISSGKNTGRDKSGRQGYEDESEEYESKEGESDLD